MIDLYRRVRPFLFIVVFCVFLWTSVRLGEAGTPTDYVLWLSTVCFLALLLTTDTDRKE